MKCYNEVDKIYDNNSKSYDRRKDAGVIPNFLKTNLENPRLA